MPSTILSDNGASSGTAGLKTSGSNDGILELQTTTGGGTATAAITIDTAQRSKFPTTIGVGGATPATSGSGISFPASASASSDENTLDDYEEGTFTPTLGGQTTNPTVTYTTQTGFYTKIGNVVTVFGKITTTVISGGSGFAIFAGLPFTIKNANCGAGSFSFYSNITLGAGYTQAALQPQANTTTVRISKSGTAISGFPPAIGDIGAAGVFDCEFQMTYQVA